MKHQELSRYINHQVTVRLTPEGSRLLRVSDSHLMGKVTNVSSNGIVLSARSTSSILAADVIEDIEIRRGRTRVVVRMVRIFSDREDVRQHLADRHGVWVGLLRSLTPEAAYSYHEKIDHTDLGHHHGDKPGTQVVDADAAERAMEELDEMHLDFSDPESEEKDK